MGSCPLAMWGRLSRPNRQVYDRLHAVPTAQRLAVFCYGCVRQELALFGRAAMSDLSPLCALKRTFADASGFMGSCPPHKPRIELLHRARAALLHGRAGFGAHDFEHPLDALLAEGAQSPQI